MGGCESYEGEGAGQPIGDSLDSYPDRESAQMRLEELATAESDVEPELVSDDSPKATVTKKERDGEHPASHYLVVEDPEAPSTWHLRVMGMDGEPDHRLMGAAWAALHEGYRGQTYQGPGKREALAALKRLYKQEDMPMPGMTGGKASHVMVKALPGNEIEILVPYGGPFYGGENSGG